MINHPCQSCGACCAFFRVSFPWSETLKESYHVPIELSLPVSPHLNAMIGTDQHIVRCVALTGELAKSVSCNIYENRPSTCRSFKASFENGTQNDDCDRARAGHGMKALILSDWE